MKTIDEHFHEERDDEVDECEADEQQRLGDAEEEEEGFNASPYKAKAAETQFT